MIKLVYDVVMTDYDHFVEMTEKYHEDTKMVHDIFDGFKENADSLQQTIVGQKVFMELRLPWMKVHRGLLMQRITQKNL